MATSIGTAAQAQAVQAGTAGAFTADRALNAAAAFWLLSALIGQWAFFYYIVAFYGPSALSGDFEVWNRLAALGRTPYVAGDTVGNLSFLAHALGAGVIAFGGALQIIPQIRKHAPVFHRWNGRVFLATVVALSLSGFYLVWVRRASAGQDFSTSLNGLLILAFAFLALRAVRARDLIVHRRWALRLYLVANAQWFLRVGVFGYFVLSRVVGHQAEGSDFFLRFWTYGCYLAPLVLLEFYIRAKDSRSPLMKSAVAGGLVLLTIFMSAGIFAFGMFSWLIVSGAPLHFPN